MSKSKVPIGQYSLLFEDDTQINEDDLSIHDEILSEDEDSEVDDMDCKSMNNIDDDSDEGEDEDFGSDDEIFNSGGANLHRSLANDILRNGTNNNLGKKNEYHLLTNNKIDYNQIHFEAPMNTLWTPTPMSPVRRAFFLASIMFGILVTAMFLWALPCNVQHFGSEIESWQWVSEFDNIGVNFSKLLKDNNGEFNIFIGFYKQPDLNDHEINKSEPGNYRLNLRPGECGLMLLNEKTGNLIWNLTLDECPNHINCDLIDATGDGLNDCLILGHGSMAMMLEPFNGNVFWHIHIHGKNNGSFNLEHHFGVPITLQDIDDDGFIELLFPLYGSIFNGKESHLMLVSGRTGAVIGKPFTLTSCHKITKIYIQNGSLSYACLMVNQNELIAKISVINLLKNITKHTRSFKYDNKTSDYDTLSTEINEARCQIKYTNIGKCPQCKTIVQVGLDADNPTYKKFQYSSIVSWKILTSGTSCKGVLLKMWRWDQTNSQDPVDPTVSVTEKLTTQKVDYNTQGLGQYWGAFKGLSNQLDINKDEIFKKSYIPNNEEPKFDLVVDDRLNEKPNSVGKKFRDNLYNSNGETIPSTDVNMDIPTMMSSLEQNSSEASFISASSALYKQKLEEKLILIILNGSEWFSRELSSMDVYHLCYDYCIPTQESQDNTALIQMNEFQNSKWDMYISSSTFFFKKNAKSTIWSIKSYIRKLSTDINKIYMEDFERIF